MILWCFLCSKRKNQQRNVFFNEYPPTTACGSAAPNIGFFNCNRTFTHIFNPRLELQAKIMILLFQVWHLFLLRPSCFHWWFHQWIVTSEVHVVGFHWSSSWPRLLLLAFTELLPSSCPPKRSLIHWNTDIQVVGGYPATHENWQKRVELAVDGARKNTYMVHLGYYDSRWL